MRSSNRPKLDRGRTVSDAIIFNLLMFIISLGLGGALQIGIAISRTGDNFSDNLSQGIINTFVVFAAIELGILILEADRLKNLVDRQDKAIRRFISHDRDIKSAERKFEYVVNNYLQRDAPAHEAVAKALLDTVANITIADDYLEVIGDQMAVASYRWFWSKVTEAQERNVEEGNGERISVFATHSAPISFWMKPEFRPIRHVQHRFIEAGGVLNRIFIDRVGKDELLPTYAKVIREMRQRRRDPFVEEGSGKDAGTLAAVGDQKAGNDVSVAEPQDTGRNIFYLRMDENDPILDFMITHFRGRHYSCEWNPRHIGSNNADIASCEFYVGRKVFEEKYCEKWRFAVDLLVEGQSDLNARLKDVELCRGDRDVLLLQPDDKALAEMLRLPL